MVIVAGIVGIAALFLGAAAGGNVGEMYHRKVDSATVGQPTVDDRL